MANFSKARSHRLRALPDGGVVSVYTIAGFPRVDSTLRILKLLEEEGVQLIELGMPYSDPVADGVVIQDAHSKALASGMSLSLLFEQLTELRNHLSIPVILMGYFNPVLQFGVERFVAESVRVGIDGAIIPDLPLSEYQGPIREHFERASLDFVPFVTPSTRESRFEEICSASSAFIYAVSTPGVTGGDINKGLEATSDYQTRLARLRETTPVLVGFGIRDRESIERVHQFSSGAIVGSAFVSKLAVQDESELRQFVRSLTSPLERRRV